MKAVHFISRIDQEASGLAHSVPNLAQSLARAGCEIELKCFAAGESIEQIKLSTYPASGRRAKARAALRFIRELQYEAFHVDILHSHSLWTLPSFAAGWMATNKRAKLVVSPRGTLAPWALNWHRRRKQVFWPLQKRLLTCADLLHATSQTEYEQFRALGLKAPVAIIPNGVDIPELQPRTAPHIKPSDQRTLLFLSRIHPIKGIDDLLRAWKALQPGHPNWRLVIAGRGEPAHVTEVERLAAAYGLKNIEFPGPLYGAEKSAAYWSADLFVLPTHTENFGIVVAEALAHGCPAVVTRGAPWAGLDSEGCGWWIERSQLTKALDHALQLSSDELQQMGARGREWMTRDFSWPAVADHMLQAYQWIRHGGEKPEFIQVD